MNFLILGFTLLMPFENKEEDDDSRLAIIDPFTNEKIQETKKDEDDYVEVDT